jgi:hypothetical protein
MLHQIKSTDGMMKTIVQGPWINQVRQAQLANSSEPLKIGVIDHIQKDGMTQRNESINRIIQNLVLVLGVYRQIILGLIEALYTKSAFFAFLCAGRSKIHIEGEGRPITREK